MAGAHLIIIGSGIAGLSAALTAAEAGIHPVILEQMPIPGGNTLLSHGYFNASDARRQYAIGVTDSPEKHLCQALAASGGKARRDLVKTFCYEAPDTLRWLEELGVRFEDKVLQVKGSHFPRTHSAVGCGAGIIASLIRALKRFDIDVLTGCRVTELIRSKNGRVEGVAFQRNGSSHRLTSRLGVIAATGGFAANRELKAMHHPGYRNVSYIGSTGSTGEVLLSAADIGASCIGMPYFETELKSDISALVLSDPTKFILLNEKNERFVREDLVPAELADAIVHLAGNNAKIICGSKRCEDESDPCPEEVLTAIRAYNRLCEHGFDADFRKSPMLLKPIRIPCVQFPIETVVTISLGGLEINEHTEVIDRGGNVIPGFTAAGDVTGGIHGERSLRGDTLASAASFGRIAAKTLIKRMRNA